LDAPARLGGGDLFAFSRSAGEEGFDAAEFLEEGPLPRLERVVRASTAARAISSF
jgi:hypothetical protein